MEEGVGLCSQVRNTSKVKKACWNSKIGIRMNDKQVNYSHGPTQTKQQVGYCVVETLLVHR
jgi:hypothetical protein